MYNPKSCEDILDEVPAKFRAENQKKNSLSKSVYMDANRARLFPDSIIKEKSANVSIQQTIRVNRKTNHHKVPDTPPAALQSPKPRGAKTGAANLPAAARRLSSGFAAAARPPWQIP